MGVAKDDSSSPEYHQLMSIIKPQDTTILGDDIYFNYVMTNLDINQSWHQPAKLLRYFRNFNKESLSRITEGEYVNPSFFQQKDKRFIDINHDFYHISTGGYGIVFRLNDYVVKFVFESNKQFSPDDTTAEYTIPKFLYNNLQGDEKKLLVCALSMGLNYRLSFLYTLYKRVLNLLILLIRYMDGEELTLEFNQKQFLKSFNFKRDNIRFVKLLSYFYPAVVQSNINIINQFGYMVNFFEHKKRTDCVYDRGNILIFPLAKFSADKVTEEIALSLGFKSLIHYVKFLFLQISLLYVKIYELPCCDNFIHADLKPDNILIFDSDHPITIKTNNNKFSYVFNENIKCALNDFDFSQVASLSNKKIKQSLKIDHNWYYDFHFFVHTLIRTYPEIEKDSSFNSALEEFIMCCNKNNCDKFRLKTSILHPICFLEKFISRDIFSPWINDNSTG